MALLCAGIAKSSGVVRQWLASSIDALEAPGLHCASRRSGGAVPLEHRTMVVPFMHGCCMHSSNRYLDTCWGIISTLGVLHL